VAERGITYVRLDLVLLAETNPKDHDDTGIGRSIGHFGFVEVPVMDERTGRLVAGHGRYEQLQTLRGDGSAPPDGVRVDPEDGMWLMPVITGWASRSDDDAKAYLVASNQLTTKGGWDTPVLAEVLTELAAADLLALTGFGDVDLEKLLASLDPEPEDEQPPPAGPETWCLTVYCDGETDRQQAFEDLTDRGYRCQIQGS